MAFGGASLLVPLYVVQLGGHPRRPRRPLRLDGSVTIRRTRGELSAECHGEAANFLAINLAHEILQDDKTVDEARSVYSEIIARKEMGDQPEYTTDFHFELPEGDQADSGQTTLNEDHKKAAQAFVDV